MKKYIVEGIGTFALSFVVLMAISNGGTALVFLPIIAGFTLGLFVYTIGGISGSHINPAVTLGVHSLKKISIQDTTAYIITQLIGGFLAFLVSSMVFHVTLAISFNQTSTLIPFVAETLGTFFFTFGIASVVYEKSSRDTAGLVVGGSLLFGILISSFSGSAGILNPAVAMALMFSSHSFSWVYVVAPIVGSYLGMQAYRQLVK